MTKLRVIENAGKLIDAIDEILKYASHVRQDIGHIRNGANVTPSELWSANESLDELFKVAHKLKGSVDGI